MSNSGTLNKDSHYQQMASRVGVRIKSSTDNYQSNDLLTLECLVCCNEIKQQYLWRKLKEKANLCAAIECRYCNIVAALPAIQAYFTLQKTAKLSEKDARANVIANFGVNPSSLWQSFRNDYRDDKLTDACRLLLEKTFDGNLAKKTQGNKFSDDELVSFLEKLYFEKPLSKEEVLQSEEKTVKRFRKKKVEGTLLPKHEERLLAVGVVLLPEKVFSTEERFEQLNAFIATHNRLPRAKEFDDKRKNGEPDHGLYAWQRHMFFKLRNQKITDQDLAHRLQATLDLLANK